MSQASRVEGRRDELIAWAKSRRASSVPADPAAASRRPHAPSPTGRAPDDAAPPTFLRLRQVCLVARELEAVVDDLCAVFGAQVCHRDPEVGRFGLHNALMRFGPQFIEVVAPLEPGTAAGRYLERRGGDGGYMLILDSESLPRWRQHVAQLGVRVAASLALGDYEGLQMHPRDTGGVLLEINCTRGGASLDGPYGPAGPHWQTHASATRVTGLSGAVLQAPAPQVLATRWAALLQGSAPEPGSATPTVHVDNAQLRFEPAPADRGEGLAAILLQGCDAAAIRAAARARGLPVADHRVTVGGVDFLLQAP